jgi:hypothetical protein
MVGVANLPIDGVEIYAIEAKLYRWRDAIKQASTYRKFADRAYVALPESTISSLVLGESEANGVGVIAVGPGGAIRVLTSAISTTSVSAARLWLLSRLMPGSHHRGA